MQIISCWRCGNADVETIFFNLYFLSIFNFKFIIMFIDLNKLNKKSSRVLTLVKNLINPILVLCIS